MTIHLTRGRVSRVATNVSELASLDIAIIEDEAPVMLVRPEVEQAIARYVEGARRQTQWSRLNAVLELAAERFLEIRGTCKGDPESLLARIAELQSEVFSNCQAAMSPEGTAGTSRGQEVNVIALSGRRA